MGKIVPIKYASKGNPIFTGRYTMYNSNTSTKKFTAKVSQEVSTLNKILGRKKGLLVPFASKFVVQNAAVHNLLLDPLNPGQYTFFWRAIGVDGHLVKGEFYFSVVGN